MACCTRAASCCDRDGGGALVWRGAADYDQLDDRGLEAQSRDVRVDESSKGGCFSCLARHIFCLALTTACLVLVGAGVVRIAVGETGHLYLTDAPLPTEKCVDNDLGFVCTLKSTFGQCPDPNCTRSCTFCDPYDGSCTSCKPYDEETFFPEAIRVDEVEHHMAFAREGSKIPEELHGIWWMDQHGASVKSLPEDYKFDFNGTAEVLISFGDQETKWQPETGCVTPVPFYGGHAGHITFFNNRHGMKQWDAFRKIKHNVHFCFTDSTRKEIHLWLSSKPPGRMSAMLKQALGYHDAGNGYLFTPQWLVHMKMVKHAWGWDRVSQVMTNTTRNALSSDELNVLKQWMPEETQELAGMVTRELHYPVVQIVDGSGNRTKHYETYLKFVERYPAQVPGTMLLAKRA